MPFVELDAVELWVGDLDRMLAQLTSSYGFAASAEQTGPEADRRTARLTNGGVRLTLRQGTHPASAVARHVAEHGDTVADVSLHSRDPDAVARRAAARGLHVSGTPAAPTIDVSGDGTICHTVRAQSRPPSARPASHRTQMAAVDHLAYCVPRGSADRIAEVYLDVFGLRPRETDSFDAVGSVETGMRSVVVSGGLTIVLTEPLSQTSTGQTQQFLDAHRGPGVQHAAIAYPDLPAAVEALRDRGVDFLAIPELYYRQAEQRLPQVPIPWPVLQRLGILVDADHGGVLFQLFAQPVADRGTFFFELIQRVGATGFGANNVRALFEAVQATLDGTGDGQSRQGA